MAGDRYTFKKFLKDWMLIIGMAVGAGAYLVYHSLPALHPAGPVLLKICRTLQPWLLFAMLFLSFCRIEPRQMRLRPWHLSLLLIQGASFVGLTLLLVWSAGHQGALASWVQAQRLPIEAAMLCLICPTATACAVVTGKLGGNMADVVTYTVLINVLVALLVPAFIPLLYPSGEWGFWEAFWKILSKVFPILIAPWLTAWLVRWLWPALHARLQGYSQLSFYIWAFSLTLAILMSTRAIVQNENAVLALAGIALATLLSCIFQFWAGKRIGARYGSGISAGQALGQKNTVFGIWMGYTFLDPILSVSGGFYSIWHNVFNTWQLYRRRKEMEA